MASVVFFLAFSFAQRARQDSRLVLAIGDVSAMRMLLEKGESLRALGPDVGLNAAAFHGHWRLCQFLLEHGAIANYQLPDTGETPRHSALCSDDRMLYDPVVKVLLAAGADPNTLTTVGASTGSFMRDCRTRGESPLHRAAAFGSEATTQLLLDAGAERELRDMIGDSPLSWASWYRRAAGVLRMLSFAPHDIHPQNRPMRANLIGGPRLDRS